VAPQALFESYPPENPDVVRLRYIDSDAGKKSQEMGSVDNRELSLAYSRRHETFNSKRVPNGQAPLEKGS
jgi:hypothetical protein